MQVCRIAVLYTYVDTVNWGGRCKLELIVSRQGQLAGCCEHGNEHLVSIKWEEFIYYLDNCQKGF
jgi:hypothetical protein